MKYAITYEYKSALGKDILKTIIVSDQETVPKTIKTLCEIGYILKAVKEVR